MKTQYRKGLKMKKISLMFTICIALLISVFMTGCGTGEDDTLDEDETGVGSISKTSLVGTYNLLRVEFFDDGLEVVIEPPKIVGTMTISSDQRIVQKLEGEWAEDFRIGVIEIFPNEGVVTFPNEGVISVTDDDVTDRATYTWDGTTLIITVSTPDYVEKHYWRKSSNNVIELQPPEWFDEPERPLVDASLSSVVPAEGSALAANGTVSVTFTEDPGAVVASVGTVTGSGKVRTISGPFAVGVLALTIAWTNGDGSHTLHYTVVGPDETPPEIIASSPFHDGEKDVDPDDVFEDGITVIFSEPVVGRLMLLDGGDDVGWLSEIDGDTITLTGFAGQELSNETEYEVAGIVSDGAGNETAISITFVTKPKE